MGGKIITRDLLEDEEEVSDLLPEDLKAYDLPFIQDVWRKTGEVCLDRKLRINARNTAMQNYTSGDFTMFSSNPKKLL